MHGHKKFVGVVHLNNLAKECLIKKNSACYKWCFKEHSCMNILVNRLTCIHKNCNYAMKQFSANSPVLLKHFVLKTSNHPGSSAK